jgi:hypothetical protein
VFWSLVHCLDQFLQRGDDRPHVLADVSSQSFFSGEFLFVMRHSHAIAVNCCQRLPDDRVGVVLGLNFFEGVRERSHSHLVICLVVSVTGPRFSTIVIRPVRIHFFRYRRASVSSAWHASSNPSLHCVR